VLLVLLGTVFFRWVTSKHSTAMQQAHSESSALNERMERLLGAWEIVWDHIELKSRLAEGTYVALSCELSHVCSMAAFAGAQTRLSCLHRPLFHPDTPPPPPTHTHTHTRARVSYCSEMSRASLFFAHSLKKTMSTITLVSYSHSTPHLLYDSLALGTARCGQQRTPTSPSQSSFSNGLVANKPTILCTRHRSKQ
jgi:hypothetical protein